MDTSGRTIDRGPPRRHPRPALAHGVAHRLSGGWRAGPLPPRLSPHRRAQPDPRQRPRAGRHAPDRAQEPGHFRPLQHHPRAGTARRRRPTRRLSGAAGAGAPQASTPGRHRRPAPRITPPPRTTRHRVKAHGPPAPARGRGRQWPDTARLCAAAHARATDTNWPAIVAHAATGQADAAEREHTPGPGCGCMPEGWMPLAGAGPHPPAGRRLTVAASGLMPGGFAARDEDGIHETGHAPSPCGISLGACIFAIHSLWCVGAEAHHPGAAVH